MSTQSMEVGGLVADVRTTSFEAFVRATAGQLQRTAVLLSGDHHLAEDLVQSTYAKVFASWRRVAAAEDPVAYARRILVRTFLSHRRLRRSSERPTDDLVLESATTDDASLRLDLLAALRSLTPDDRAVLVLRYWEDLGSAEAARVLGISDAACRQRTVRALVRMRALMPELEDER